MSNNNEKLKSKGGPAFENDGKRVKPFGTFNPMQQERILTHMNTIGSKKEEMRRFSDPSFNAESGMTDTL
ncbi:MAG: hypothetical protein IJE28_10520 [Oscillospiraceae bacterium]|nr:hypothetical protein [Oscillospiraceae bacterium]MBQ3501240.1 hypothetical protein [Oscillospiraceae bacterium]MBQ4547451.1 hypothetical protein [Oscillospiraceae bacterium]MBQ4643431.1 hypothetical protein [Oscillospiraceae bacterium]